jgi:hypothetical protein
MGKGKHQEIGIGQHQKLNKGKHYELGTDNIRKWVRKTSGNVPWSGGKIQVQMKHNTIETCARETSGNGHGKHQEMGKENIRK